MTTASGDVGVEDGDGSIELKSMSGDVNLELSRLGSADNTVSTVSGDVSIELPDAVGVDLNAKSATGDINVDLELESEERSKRSVSGKARGGGVGFSVLTVSGDISIE